MTIGCPILVRDMPIALMVMALYAVAHAHSISFIIKETKIETLYPSFEYSLMN